MPRTVQGGENSATGEPGKVIRNVGKRVSVLFSDGIELAIIDGPPNFVTIILWDRNEREGPRGVSFFHHILCQPLVHLFPQGTLHRWIQGAVFDFDGM